MSCFIAVRSNSIYPAFAVRGCIVIVNQIIYIFNKTKSRIRSLRDGYMHQEFLPDSTADVNALWLEQARISPQIGSTSDGKC